MGRRSLAAACVVAVSSVACDGVTSPRSTERGALKLIALDPGMDTASVAVSLNGGGTFSRARPAWLITDLEPNTYDVVARAPAYRDWTASVRVVAHDTASVTAQLQYRAGDVAVTSTPDGAAIWLYDGTPGHSDRSGQYVDTGSLTPDTLEDVRTGSYVVLLKKADYEEASDWVTVWEDRLNAVHITLPPRPSYLALSSEPPGAAVWFDGVDLAKVTPTVLEDLVAGRYTLKLVHPTHHDWTREITVPPNDTVEISAELSENLTVLVVDSEPPGAVVLLDGVEQSESTPAQFDHTSPGARVVRLQLDGYRDWSETVSVIVDDTTRVAVELEQAFGSLHVVSNPAGAGITLDDVDTGRWTPATLEQVPLAQHVVTVELPGYGPASRMVKLDTDGQTEVVSFDLDVLCPGDNVIGNPALGPSISITGLAPGDRSVVGTVSNVDLGATDHRVVLWAKTDHWYVQPYIAAPWTAVCGDGTWRNGTHPWDRMVAVLVDAETFGTPPSVLYLHPALRSGVLAWTEFPQPRVIDFGGYRWLVKASDEYRVGPGPNFFSAAAGDIWKDEEGRVHLTTSEHDGKWWSTEMVMEDHLGYGEYRFTLDSRVDSLDYRAVFSGFIYESLSQEIDIEFSQTLADPDNAQYVVQPYTRAGNLTRYEIGDSETSTHRMLWLGDRIVFESWLGDAPDPTPETLLNSWTYTGVDIPVPDNERMRFNLWLFNGAAPSSGIGDEVIIRSFDFTPR